MVKLKSNCEGAKRIHDLENGETEIMILEKNDKISDGLLIITETEKSSSSSYTFEEAICEAGIGRLQFFLLLVCGFCNMSVSAQGILLSYVLPPAKCDIPISTVEQGILNSIGFVGIAVSSHFWGFIADTCGRLKVLRIALFMGSFWSILSSFSINVNMLIWTRFLCGLFISGTQATSFTYLSEFHSKKTCTKAVTFAAMFMPIALMYLPAIAYFIIPIPIRYSLFGITDLTSWRIFILISNFVNVLAFFAFCLLPESPKFLLTMNRNREAINVLKFIYKTNKNKPKNSYKVMKLQREETGSSFSDAKGVFGVLKLLWNQTVQLFIPPHLKKTIQLCFLMFILYSIGQGSYMWIPEFFMSLTQYINESKTLCEVMSITLNVVKNVTNTTEAEITSNCIDLINPITYYITFLIGVVFTGIYIFMGLYIERIGRKLFLCTWLTVTSIACFSITLSTHFYLSVVLIIAYLSCGLCASILNAISVNMFPTNIRAMGLCLTYLFGRIGSVAGSNFIAFLITTNCNLIFYISTGFIFSCVLAMGYL